MVYVVSIATFVCLFIFGIITAFSPTESDGGKILGVVCTIIGLVGFMVAGYLSYNAVMEKLQENNQKIEMVTEREKYNKKKQNELLTEKFKLPITDILIESILETEYYKVTTNEGIYKVAFAFDSDDRIIGFKEFKQIISAISKESNHEQGSHN
ncbi:hypothetical protein MC28_D094 (plasmid) [Bacillus thuringiensis MC28]|nr:hypothetical protein MC28_D094 [Bacillus thuringiensis MC28]